MVGQNYRQSSANAFQVMLFGGVIARAIAQFASTVRMIQPDGILARHPLHLVSPRIASEDHPLALLTSCIQAAESHRATLDTTLSRSTVPRDQWEQLARARLLIEYGKRVQPVSRLGQMRLLDPKSDRGGQFAKLVKRYSKGSRTGHRTGPGRPIGPWKQKIAAEDVESTWELAASRWRPKLSLAQTRVVADCEAYSIEAYDFRRIPCVPAWSQVLNGLRQEVRRLVDDLEKQRRAIAETYQIEGDVEELVGQVLELRKSMPNLPDWLLRIHTELLHSDKAKQIVEAFVEADAPLADLTSELNRVFDDASG